MKKLISDQYITFGADPEFFIQRKDKKGRARIVGSEKVIPREGLAIEGGRLPIVIRDGVQGELNPQRSTCRQSLAHNILDCWKLMQKHLKEGQSINLEPLVRVTKLEMASLGDDAKAFGCEPSYNIYTSPTNLESPAELVDPRTYRYRSAGGHIHLGGLGLSTPKKLKLIKMLDILVGNTCVLIDRHEGNVERRRLYGRAGEFRLPPYGVEYRTPSNFWLKHYILQSLVMGLCRMAQNVVAQSTPLNNYYKKLMDKLPEQDIRDAINNNDFDLAYKNFKVVKKFIITYVQDSFNWGLTPKRLKNFELFIQKPLEHWFPKTIEQYVDSYEGGGIGDGAESYFYLPPKIVVRGVHTNR